MRKFISTIISISLLSFCVLVWSPEAFANNTQDERPLKSVVLTAVANDQYYELDSAGSVVVKNTSRQIPIEVTVNSDFPEVGDYTNPEESDDIILIYPGQYLQLSFPVTKIGYRSKYAPTKIQVIAGEGISVSSSDYDPTAEDIQIVRYGVKAVDRNSRKIFASISNKVMMSEDGGETWELRTSLEDRQTFLAGFYTDSGTLLAITDKRSLLRSTDDGQTFELIDTGTSWRAMEGVAQNPRTGTILYGENPQYAERDEQIRIRRSVDDGRSWDDVLIRTGADVRHFHSVDYDVFTGHWYATTGDLDEQIEWWVSKDDGLTWKAIVGADSGVKGDQTYRTLGLMFTDSKIIWPTDNSLDFSLNYVVAAPKDDPSNIDKLLSLPGVGFAKVQYGPYMLIGTQYDKGLTQDKTAQIYISKDSGESWEQIVSWPIIDGVRDGGFASISKNPSSDGYFYLLARYLHGAHGLPWAYGTLKIKF